MYTGIVQASCELVAISEQPNLRELVIALPAGLLDGLGIGASVGVDGVCLTVTAIDGKRVHFDVMRETLDLTTLGDGAVGDRLNIERSASGGAEIGGHVVSGHVDATATIVAVDQSENRRVVHYEVPAALMRYIFRKGFVALDGCSVTVVDADRRHNRFSVSYIPATLRMTTHGRKGQGDRVNLEVERQTQAIVDTVERMLRDNPDLLGSLR